MDAYPDGPHKVLNFLSYDVLLGLQLDHIYRYGGAGRRAGGMQALGLWGLKGPANVLPRGAGRPFSPS
jgi:hypothetical protein